MAGFFLYETNCESISVQNVRITFEKKGLHSPSQFTFGCYTLLLYPKMISQKPQFVETEEGFCCAVGTYIYKGLDYAESLSSSLKDFAADRLALDEMYGQYTLLFFCNGAITLISDALFAKHIFTDIGNHFFSSSLFAAIDALPKVSLHRNAVLEKMMTGVIATPDTVVNEIIQLGRHEQEEVNRKKQGVSFVIHPRMSLLPPHNKGRKESVKAQAAIISEYFKKISPALSSGRVDMGMSAGHDSTLVFAAAYPYLRDKLHLHTHSTGHVHDREKNAAAAIAGKKKLGVNIVPTPRLDEPDIDLEGLLNENLEFFDGRTSHDIGGFSATYRAEYRLKATEGCETSITGVGGECLRNHYSVIGKRINSDYFFDEVAFNPSFRKAVSKEVYANIKEYHLKKVEKILGCKLHGKVDRLQLRRYYSEFLMPDGQGHVIDAYNLVSHCFSPFLDEHIIQEAYRGIYYLGNCGEYESAIICELDNEIGKCINSNNGYPFDHIPGKLRFRRIR